MVPPLTVALLAPSPALATVRESATTLEPEFCALMTEPSSPVEGALHTRSAHSASWVSGSYVPVYLYISKRRTTAPVRMPSADWAECEPCLPLTPGGGLCSSFQ